MELRRLRATHLRCFDEVDLAPEAGLNYLVGPNGAGKTTILEAIYLLSHGRSFRGGTLDVLTQRGRSNYSVHAELASASGGLRSLGMTRMPDGWRLHVNGLVQSTLTSLLEHCASLCFEPGSHTLITGGAEERRHFLDWGVFHVEQTPLGAWKSWRRALRQRNTLLRTGGSPGQFRAWEFELERFATPIEAARRRYFESLGPHLQQFAERLLPELGQARLCYQAGWNTEQSLGDVLAEQRQQDIRHGRTRSGPHKADWRLGFEQADNRDFLSRGQTRLAALACVLAQASLFAARKGEWPILCLDDPVSELDSKHQELIFEELASAPVQAWVTAVDAGRLPHVASTNVFHVEHRAVRQARPRLRVV